MGTADKTPAAVSVLEQRRYRAMLDADLGVLDALLAESLIYTHSDGARDSKTSYLAKVRSGHMQYASLTTSEEEVRMLGLDCACLTGRMQLSGELGGVTTRLDNLFLALWVYVGEQWRLAAFQPTPVPPLARSLATSEGFR